MMGTVCAHAPTICSASRPAPAHADGACASHPSAQSLLLAGVGFGKGGVAGTCGKGATSSLKVAAKDGGLEVEFEVDHNRSRVTWRVVLISTTGAVVWRGTRTTGAPSGSFASAGSCPTSPEPMRPTAPRASSAAPPRPSPGRSVFPAPGEEGLALVARQSRWECASAPRARSNRATSGSTSGQ